MLQANGHRLSKEDNCRPHRLYLTGTQPARNRENHAMTALTSIASSGLQAAQLRSGVAAHNVANLQTPAFQRQSVTQQASMGGGVAASVSNTSQTGPRLEEDMAAQMSATYSFKANWQPLRTADQMLGTLLDVHA